MNKIEWLAHACNEICFFRHQLITIYMRPSQSPIHWNSSCWAAGTCVYLDSHLIWQKNKTNQFVSDGLLPLNSVFIYLFVCFCIPLWPSLITRTHWIQLCMANKQRFLHLRLFALFAANLIGWNSPKRRYPKYIIYKKKTIHKKRTENKFVC